MSLSVLNMLGGGKPEGLYAWKKLSAQGGDFIDYVVSDKESAYPNGAVHTDGYYYEKVGGGLTPEMFGCTKMAVDKFTYSSIQNLHDKLSINHSLGEVPRLAIIISDFNITSSLRLVTNLMGIISGDVMAYGYTLLYSGSETYSSITCSTQSDSAISVYSTQNEHFYYGVEYTLITMA